MQLPRLFLFDHAPVCRLSNLPPEMAKLCSLKKLRISYNNFTKLTPVIGTLTRLETLKADNNQIMGLIPDIGNLTRLKKLWLHKNKILQVRPILEICLHTHACVCACQRACLRFNALSSVWITTGPLRMTQNTLTIGCL